MLAGRRVVAAPLLIKVLFATPPLKMYISPPMAVVLFATPPLEMYIDPPPLTVVLFATPPLDTVTLLKTLIINPVEVVPAPIIVLALREPRRYSATRFLRHRS